MKKVLRLCLNSTMVRFKLQLETGFHSLRSCLNSTMVRFKLNNKAWNSNFKGFSLNSTMVRFKLRIFSDSIEISRFQISIPPWFDSNQNNTDKNKRIKRSLNSTYGSIQIKVFTSSSRKDFRLNSTMVRFK